ncbi:HD domain-containing protein [Candidatus Woesearchaeota archaeon]|nr:HD domain-containing protein [Candidatus Woesearchaeota archaeon]
MLKDFHHFKGSELTRSEKIQRKVVELILESKIPDETRESSFVWELKHSSGCCQVGRILAQKRSLDIELSEIICILHDIAVIVEGSYKDHAKRGAEIAKKMLEESGYFSREEIGLITEAIAHHSEKQAYTGNPYVELAKDADVFDCSLYQNAKGFYLLHKPKEIYKEYVKRIISVRKELGLRQDEFFREE